MTDTPRMKILSFVGPSTVETLMDAASFQVGTPGEVTLYDGDGKTIAYFTHVVAVTRGHFKDA